MIVVFDTNVLVAALTTNGLCSELLLRAMRLRILASSDVLLDELEATLRAKFQVTPAVDAFLGRFRESIRIVEPVALPKPVCRDATDDVGIATAIAVNADAIVTGDQDLLVVERHEGVPIMTPRAFFEHLDRLEG